MASDKDEEKELKDKKKELNNNTQQSCQLNSV